MRQKKRGELYTPSFGAELVFKDPQGNVARAQIQGEGDDRGGRGAEEAKGGGRGAGGAGSSGYSMAYEPLPAKSEIEFEVPGEGDSSLPQMRRSEGGINARISSTAPLPPVRSSRTGSVGGNSPQRTTALSRDLGEMLERGSLEDLGDWLESHPPRPDSLPPSQRNKLYDLISTLLLQGRHVERCLMWVLSLVRERGGDDKGGLFGEVAMHTQRDLQDALQRLSHEPSKRGLLASLLSSQISKKIDRELH
ncbi:hypothetical protein EON64_02475 [archaeon]|nr:MAG: hypothetical protein EON64_02475 [archaeon]